MIDKDLEKAIYRWFDVKYETYNKLDYKGSIYLYNDYEEIADVFIDIRYDSVYCKKIFFEEFFMTFSLDRFQFKEFLKKWVKDRFNTTVVVRVLSTFAGDFLTIPK